MREKLIELLTYLLECELAGDCSVMAEGWADHLIANGVVISNSETTTKWIPVTERLPEESGEYLAYCGEYDGICILYCDVLKTKIKWRTKWKEVTHWMPMPPEPKGE